MLTLKHLITFRHVSILIENHQGVRWCLVKVTEFLKKSLSLKFLKVNRGDVTEYALHLHTVRLFTEGDDTRGCGDTIGPREDEQRAARNMLRIVV